MNSKIFQKVDRRPLKRVPLLLSVLIFIEACAVSDYPAPVDNSTPIQRDRVTTHRVAKGETLYGIAWRYHIDFKELAAVNGFSPDQPLAIGQALSLDLSKRPKPTQVNRINVDKKVIQNREESTRPKKNVAVVDKNMFSDNWFWPVRIGDQSRRIARSQLNKALDIGGKIGESVTAAAPGRIVYAGDGLRGYGNLVIIKHSDEWLSAYGNNRSILVKEGQIVKAKQIIAELGIDDSQQARLHFEVRKDGTPVDPRSVLPNN